MGGTETLEPRTRRILLPVPAFTCSGVDTASRVHSMIFRDRCRGRIAPSVNFDRRRHVARPAVYGDDMTIRFDLVGVVVADMARSLAFYRRLGIDLPPDADSQPHVEAQLQGGVRMAWDTIDVIRSFDPGWTPPTGGHGLASGVRVREPGRSRLDVCRARRRRQPRPSRALGCVLGAALRRRSRPGRQLGRPVRRVAVTEVSALRPSPRPGASMPQRHCRG